MSVMGNRWGFALLVAAFVGISRFTDFQSQLGAPPGSIADRLSIFTANGVLVAVGQPIPAHREGPGVVRGAGRALQWAQRWFQAPEGPAVILTHTACGDGSPALTCDQCAVPLTGAQVAASLVEPGDEELRRNLAVGIREDFGDLLPVGSVGR